MADYSAKSLKERLGLTPGMSTHFSHAPAEYFKELGLRAAPNRGADENGVYDFIHAFFTEKGQLIASVYLLTSILADKGVLWISYPKSSQELTEEVVKEALSNTGLITKETTVIIDNWLGTKFVL